MSSTNVATNNISAKNGVDLSRLVNLALNSPRVGVVNFNILKTFLIELLKALNLQNYEPKFGEDTHTKALIQDFIKINDAESNADNSSFLNDTGFISELTNTSLDATSPAAKGLLSLEQKPFSERFHNLEDKMTRLEQQISALNSMPPNNQLIERARETRRDRSSGGPILEVWQYTQLSKRLESNEEGLTKLTSLLQDLIGDLNEIKDSQTKNCFDIKELHGMFDLIKDQIKGIERMRQEFPSLDQFKDLEREIDMLRDNIKDIEKFNEKFKILNAQVRTIEVKIENYLMKADAKDFVTWTTLEKMLKGIRDMIEEAKHHDQHPQDTHTTQTSPIPKARSDSIVKSGTPAIPTNEPSKELKEILFKLGTLNQRHEYLQVEVEDIMNDLKKLPKEIPKQDQPAFKLPEGFAEKIDEIMKLKSEMTDIRNGLDKESSKRMQLENLLLNINGEIDKLKSALKECLESTKINKKDIVALQEAIKLLEETKADKDWMRRELDKKADRRELENKLNKNVFDETCTEMSHNINNALQKSINVEDNYRKDYENIIKELEGKLDRMELGPFKEYIEKQLKKIKKLQKEAHEIQHEDDAAGMRKQLRFNCISCDRPIDAIQQPAYPSLPNERGLRPIQSPRPFTTYELEQIRQFQRQQTIHENGYDLFATTRQAGGPHTLTLPHRKFAKIPPQVPEENVVLSSPSAPNLKSEVQIQGQDGHIYKGRIDAKLSVEIKKPKTAQANLNVTSMSSLVERPNSVPAKAFSKAPNNQNNNNNKSVDKVPVYTN